MSESKCFCHFNGYEVKDAKARRAIDEIRAEIPDVSDGVISLKVDQSYNKESVFAQSGKAVSEAVSEAVSTSNEYTNEKVKAIIAYTPPSNRIQGDYEGQIYIDLTNNDIYYYCGLDENYQHKWLSGGTSGSGGAVLLGTEPPSVRTAGAYIGQLYIDTSSHTVYYYSKYDEQLSEYVWKMLISEDDISSIKASSYWVDGIDSTLNLVLQVYDNKFISIDDAMLALTNQLLYEVATKEELSAINENTITVDLYGNQKTLHNAILNLDTKCNKLAFASNVNYTKPNGEKITVQQALDIIFDALESLTNSDLRA